MRVGKIIAIAALKVGLIAQPALSQDTVDKEFEQANVVFKNMLINYSKLMRFSEECNLQTRVDLKDAVLAITNSYDRIDPLSVEIALEDAYRQEIAISGLGECKPDFVSDYLRFFMKDLDRLRIAVLKLRVR